MVNAGAQQLNRLMAATGTGENPDVREMALDQPHQIHAAVMIINRNHQQFRVFNTG